MPAATPENAPKPFVETTIARHLLNRLRMTHEERAISVFSGPWGIGKTTALDAFAAEHEGQCAIVKVEAGTRGKGAAPTRVMQFIAEALERLEGREGTCVATSYLTLRHRIFEYMIGAYGEKECAEGWVTFTFIFDEAQYLSREAIETLRYWNDVDRCTLPCPVGLVFVGNNEFSLQEGAGGQSTISGAVRSRALFIEALEYSDVTDADLVLFIQSRGITDPAAISAIVSYYSSPRVRRDLRNVERILAAIRRRAGGEAITSDTVRSILISA